MKKIIRNFANLNYAVRIKVTELPHLQHRILTLYRSVSQKVLNCYHYFMNQTNLVFHDLSHFVHPVY